MEHDYPVFMITSRELVDLLGSAYDLGSIGGIDLFANMIRELKRMPTKEELVEKMAKAKDDAMRELAHMIIARFPPGGTG